MRIAEPRSDLFLRASQAFARRNYGKELDPMKAHAHRRPLMLGYGALELAFERSRKLDHRLTDLAVIKAATLVGCEFCMDIGSALGRKAGVTEEQLRELPRYRESEAFSELEKLVLDYAVAMTRTPVEVPEELCQELRRHLDDGGLVELTAAIALENYRARFNHALGIGSQGFSEGAFCVLPERPAAEPAAAP